MCEDEDSQIQKELPEATQGSKLILVMVIILHTLYHLMTGALPILYPSILDEFQLSYIQLGFLQSASRFAGGFPQMFVGTLRKWFSRRVLIGFGNIITAIFTSIAAFVGSFHQFIALRVMAGIGGSSQHPIGTSILTTNTGPSWRGRIYGLNLSAPMLASTLSPLIAAWLLVARGWRITLFILAMPLLVASFVTILFVKEKNDSAVKLRTFSLGDLLNSLRSRNVLAISTLRSVTAFRMGVRAFIPLFFIEALHMSTGLSSTLYSLMIFGGVLGPFFWGYLSDRMARKPLVLGILIIQCLLFYSLKLVNDVFLLAPILFLIGFMAQTVVMQGILADSVERAQLDQVFGFYYTLGFTLSSLSTIVYAYVVDTLGFYFGFTYIAAVTGVSIIPALFIKEIGRH